MINNFFLLNSIFISWSCACSKEPITTYLRSKMSLNLNSFPVMARMDILNVSLSVLMELDLDLVHKPKTHKREENETEQLYFIVHTESEMNRLMKIPDLPDVSIDSHLTERMKYVASLAIPDKKPNMYRSNRKSVVGYDSISYYFDCFRNLESSLKTMWDIEESYPNLAEVVKIGNSYHEEYDILVLKLTNKESLVENKAKMFAIFGLHAREYAPPELGARFAETLVQNYSKNADITYILDTVEIHLVLQANPDGRKIAETFPELYWRKNANPSNGCEEYSYGVDLNRNFPYKWGRKGASDNPCSNIYHGEKRLSEPETKALVEHVNAFFETNETGIFLDVHSYGRMDIWPYTYKENALTPDQDKFVALARKFSKMNGHILSGPGMEDFIGVASGSSLDYAYAEKGLMAFAMELGDDFYQECNEFESDIYPRNFEVLLYSAKIAGNPFEMSMGPDVKILSLGSNTIPQRSSFCVLAELFQAEKEDSFETDVTVIMSIDSVQVANFSLSNSVQKFKFFVDSTHVGIGQHMLHLEGTDEIGYTGPKSSFFFEVCDPIKDEQCKEHSNIFESCG